MRPDPEGVLSRVLGIGLQARALEAVALLAPEIAIHAVASTAAALEALRTRHFHVILVDGSAPDLTTGDLEQLRAAAPETPKLFLARGDEASFYESLRDPSLAYLSGGFAADELARRIRRAVRRRVAARLEFIGSPFRVRGGVAGHRFDHPLADLSSRGLSFTIRADHRVEAYLPGTAIAAISVVDSVGQPVLTHDAAIVRSLRRERDDTTLLRVGLSLEDPPPGRSTYAYRVQTPQAALAVVQRAARAGGTFNVSLPDRDDSWEYPAAETSKAAPVALTLAGPPPEPLPEYAVLRLAFAHHGQSFSGLCSVLPPSPEGRLRVSVPQSLRAHHRRGTNRLRPGQDRPWRARLVCSFTGFDRTLPVLDLHAGGLSVAMDGTEDVAPSGLVLDLVEIWAPGCDVPTRAHGTVRRFTPLPRSATSPDAHPARCGVELSGLSHDDAAALEQRVVAERHPYIAQAPPEAFDAIWGLLAEAGFNFHVYRDGTPQTRETVRHAFTKLLQPATDVGFNLVYTRDAKVRGHISGLRLYKRTWVAAHLAAVQGLANSSSERVSRALTQAISERFESEPSAEFVKVMWQKNQALLNRMHSWSGRAHQPGLSERREFAVLTCTEPRPAPDPSVRLRDADGSDLALIEQHFVQSVSPLRIQSEDLSRAGLELAEVGEAYARAGLERRRRIRVAEVDGQFAGFSLLEESTKALHLTEVSNAFDVFAAAGLPEDVARRVRGQLVRESAQLSFARGLPVAVAFAGDPDLSPYLDAGFTLAGTARSWTWHRSLLRAWADAWDQLFERQEILEARARRRSPTP